MTVGVWRDCILSPFCIKCSKGKPSDTNKQAISIPNLSFNIVESMQCIAGDFLPL
jgi:hypothetical protein